MFFSLLIHDPDLAQDRQAGSAKALRKGFVSNSVGRSRRDTGRTNPPRALPQPAAMP